MDYAQLIIQDSDTTMLSLLSAHPESVYQLAQKLQLDKGDVNARELWVTLT